MTSPNKQQQDNTTADDQTQDQQPTDGEAGQDELAVEWGGKLASEAPDTLKLDEPVTVTFAPSTKAATITVDDDDPDTEAWTQRFKFGEAGQENIQAEITQDEQEPRRVTVKATEWPSDAETLTVDWGGKATAVDDGGQSDNPGEDGGDGPEGEQPADGEEPPAGEDKPEEGGEAPTELTKDKPELTVMYDKSVTKANISVDDDDPETEAFSKVVKFPAADEPEEPGEGEQPEDPESPDEEQPPEDEPQDIQVDLTQDEQNPRKVTLEVSEFPEGDDQLQIDWGGETEDKPGDKLNPETPKVDATYAESETGPVTIKVTGTNDKANPWEEEVTFPGEGEQPEEPGEGEEPPADGEQPEEPGEGEEPPADGEQPDQPGDGEDKPPEGDQPDGEQPPADGEEPAEGEEPPAEGDDDAANGGGA